MRIRSTHSRGFDHDSVAFSQSRMSTVARRVRSSRFRTFDHDSATRGLEALTMIPRARSSPDCALDHDVGRPCLAGVVEEANRVRSPRSGASDHDCFTLCEAAGSELRSSGCTCFPDHRSTAKSATSSCATGGILGRQTVFVNEKKRAVRPQKDTGTGRVLVPINSVFPGRAWLV
jgi:hypothetical protein